MTTSSHGVLWWADPFVDAYKQTKGLNCHLLRGGNDPVILSNKHEKLCLIRQNTIIQTTNSPWVICTLASLNQTIYSVITNRTGRKWPGCVKRVIILTLDSRVSEYMSQEEQRGGGGCKQDENDSYGMHHSELVSEHQQQQQHSSHLAARLRQEAGGKCERKWAVTWWATGSSLLFCVSHYVPHRSDTR